MAKISWRAQWMSSLAGTVVGTAAWLLNIGRYVWPQHPWWALFFMTITATFVTMFIAAADEARNKS
jgi:hypothetical protein